MSGEGSSVVPDLAGVRDRDGVAEERAVYEAMRHFWHPVMFASELRDRPCQVFLLGEQLVVVRLGGEVRVFPDLCVHRGTALSLGWVEDGTVLRCAYHGWSYGSDGVCTSIPARFGSNIPRRAHLHRYLAIERYGLIWVCLENEPRFSLPAFPQYEDPTYRSVEVPAYDWDTSFARRIENYVDFSHFAWVHDGILGNREEPEVPDHEVWRDGPELRFGEAFFAPPPEADPEAPRAREVEGLPFQTGTILADKAYRLTMPGTVLMDQRFPGGKHYVLFFTVCPIGPKRTRCFTFMTRNYDLDASQDEKFVAFNDVIVGQDRPVVESQRPEELPVDLAAELHIRGVDRISLDYRRWLAELARDVGGLS